MSSVLLVRDGGGLSFSVSGGGDRVPGGRHSHAMVALADTDPAHGPFPVTAPSSALGASSGPAAPAQRLLLISGVAAHGTLLRRERGRGTDPATSRRPLHDAAPARPAGGSAARCRRAQPARSPQRQPPVGTAASSTAGRADTSCRTKPAAPAPARLAPYRARAAWAKTSSSLSRCVSPCGQ